MKAAIDKKRRKLEKQLRKARRLIQDQTKVIILTITQHKTHQQNRKFNFFFFEKLDTNRCRTREETCRSEEARGGETGSTRPSGGGDG